MLKSQLIKRASGAIFTSRQVLRVQLVLCPFKHPVNEANIGPLYYQVNRRNYMTSGENLLNMEDVD